MPLVALHTGRVGIVPARVSVTLLVDTQPTRFAPCTMVRHGCRTGGLPLRGHPGAIDLCAEAGSAQAVCSVQRARLPPARRPGTHPFPDALLLPLLCLRKRWMQRNELHPSGRPGGCGSTCCEKKKGGRREEKTQGEPP
jgi:hypothetical protein